LVKYFGNQGTEVVLEEAPEPKEIIWEFINYPSGKRFGRVILGWGLSVAFIAFVTVIFYFVLKWKSTIIEEE
jgi:hypothetical protein